MLPISYSHQNMKIQTYIIHGDKIMLKKINEGRVESDDGFSIHITGLESLKYQENDNYIIFEWNYDPKTQKIYVYASDVDKWNEPSKVILTGNHKKKVIENLKNAVKLLKGKFEIV